MDRAFLKGTRITLALFCVAASFVLAEVLLFLLAPWWGFYEYDPDMGFRVRAHAHGANQFGFNDRDYPLQKSGGIYRILMINDSFGWEGGLNANYTALLENKLESHFGKHAIDVINSGYPMTHTGEQLPMLKKFGLQYDPDMVILGFFAGNDFLDANPFRKRVAYNDLLYFDVDSREPVPTFWGRPLIGKSLVFMLIKQKYMVWRSLEPHFEKEDQPFYALPIFLGIESQVIQFYLPKLHAARAFNANVRYAVESLSAMNGLLKKRKIKFLVAILPDQLSVDDALAGVVLDSLRIERSDFDGSLAQKLLTDYFRREQIPYIDLLPVFRKAGKEKRLYRAQDIHWNRQGNELAAEAIAGYLLQSKTLYGHKNR